MNVNDIKSFVPLKAQAEAAFQQQDYLGAANYIIDFADHLTQYYEDGDTSYDSLRVAWLGTSSAALILGQVDHEDAEYYSKEALKFGRKLYEENNSPNNAVQIVTSTQFLLHNINLYNYYYNDSTYYNDAITLAEKLIGFLNKSFPNEESINNVVNAFKYARNLFEKRVEHVKLYERLGSNSQTDQIAATNALSDSTEFEYLYYRYWRKNINLEADDSVIALHSLILTDESLAYARECKISEMCTTEGAEEWDGLSDEFFDSYNLVCQNYGIDTIDYYEFPNSAAIPFISNHSASIFEKNVIRCFLSLFTHKVPIIKECSLIFDADDICGLVEQAYNDNNEDIGRFLLNFVQCLINFEAVFIDNSLLAAKARKLSIESYSLQYNRSQLSREDVEEYEKDCQVIAEEIETKLNRYIDNVNFKGFPNNLMQYKYNSMSIYGLLKAHNLGIE